MIDKQANNKNDSSSEQQYSDFGVKQQKNTEKFPYPSPAPDNDKSHPRVQTHKVMNLPDAIHSPCSVWWCLLFGVVGAFAPVCYFSSFGINCGFMNPRGFCHSYYYLLVSMIIIRFSFYLSKFGIYDCFINNFIASHTTRCDRYLIPSHFTIVTRCTD